MAAATAYHPCLAQTAIQRQPPEVGAVCEKDACPDLCGGREVTCVPTATPFFRGAISGAAVPGYRNLASEDARLLIRATTPDFHVNLRDAHIALRAASALTAS